MTTQDKLKIITDNIRQKLPRLMELEEGCLVEIKINEYVSYISKVIGTTGGNQIADTGDYDDFYIILNSDFEGYEKRYADDEDVEIIGKEPMLTDVLEWAENTDKYLNSFLVLTIDFYGSICNIDHDSEHLNIIGYGENIKWDLTKPYLKDQSKEVIDFLYNFIENEKTP